jgi:type I restriction enzyme M protein
MFEQTFKNIAADLRNEAGCTTEHDYTEQTFWLLSLKHLDGLEQDKAMEAELGGRSTPSSSTNPTAGQPGPRRRT